MPFEKGHSLSKGRPKGATNKADLNSLRILLQGSFHENRLVIRDMLNSMYVNTKNHIDELNKRIAELALNDKDYTYKLRDYSNARSSLLEEFKWLLSLKASLEPKISEISGKDGEPLELSPPVIVFEITKQEEDNDNGNGRVEMLHAQQSPEGSQCN